MSWKTENALKRVFNAFKRSKEKIYKEDIEALKLLNDELKTKQEVYVNDNLLYAKLLCYVLDRNLHHNGDVKASIKIVSDILKEPLDYHLQMFQTNLNNKGLENYLLSIGYNLELLDHSKEKKESNESILKDKEKEIIEKLKVNWTYEAVKKSFYNTANEFLQETDNYI